MLDTTLVEALKMLRQTWDLLESSADKSQDLLSVIDELIDLFFHLATLKAEGD